MNTLSHNGYGGLYHSAGHSGYGLYGGVGSLRGDYNLLGETYVGDLGAFSAYGFW